MPPILVRMAAPVFTGSPCEIRSRHTSVKWVAYPAEVLPMWVAEMDAAPCEPVVEAVTAAMRRGDTGYAWGPPYAEALARFARARWDWEPAVAQCTVVADVMIGVAEVLRAVTGPGDAVVVSPPCYDSFFGFTQALGRRSVEAPLTAQGRLSEDSLAGAFAEATAAGARAAYVLCNPQNPTGTVHTRAELEMLAALAERFGVQVVADEIHAPLVYAGGPAFVPYLSVAGGERGIAVFSPSKGWNLAGLKSALVVFGTATGSIQGAFHEVHTHGASHVAVQAHIAALDDGREWLDRAMAELTANLTLLGEELAAQLPQVRWQRPEATYLAWLDCRGLGLGDDPAAEFLRLGQVALSSGPRYGRVDGAGFARFNVATSPQVIREAVSRMALAVPR